MTCDALLPVASLGSQFADIVQVTSPLEDIDFSTLLISNFIFGLDTVIHI